jgi:hypothetical protein
MHGLRTQSQTTFVACLPACPPQDEALVSPSSTSSSRVNPSSPPQALAQVRAVRVWLALA